MTQQRGDDTLAARHGGARPGLREGGRGATPQPTRSMRVSAGGETGECAPR
jgi:hypothetical protein